MSNKARIVVTSVPAKDSITLVPELAQDAIKNILDDLKGRSLDLVLLPQYSSQIAADEQTLQRFAAENKCYVVYNTFRQEQTHSTCVSTLVDRNGSVIGEYSKTHKIEGLDVPDLVLGNETPVFALDFGKVALLTGTDLFFPELAEIYSVKGAELLLVQLGPLVLRDDAELQRLLKARSVADYMYVAASGYASNDPMYMASNVDLFHGDNQAIELSGELHETFNAYGLGKHTGRAAVYDLRGETIGGTGRESGFCECELDMDRKRNLKTYNFGTGCVLFHQNQRGVFRELSDTHEPVKKDYAVKNPVISMVHIPYKDTFQNTSGDWYEPILATIEQAALMNSDFIVCSEYSRGDGIEEITEGLEQFIQGCSRIAAKYSCYVAMNEVIDGMNTSLLFGRDGKEIHRHVKVNPLNMMYDNKPPAGSVIEPVELDFGKIGFMICADSYCQEIPRIYGLKGADLIVLQTQSWGYDANAINEGVARAWAIENCLFVLTCGYPSSQITHRSNIIDPTGETVFATNYDRMGIYTTRLNLEAAWEKVSFIYREGKVYRDVSFRERLMRSRRPEIYGIVAEGATACL